MQVVNDDMDELYRKAAGDYPLNTDSADWNAVLKKMQDQKLQDDGSGKKNYRQLLWLLLLIPLGLFYKNYFTNERNKAPVSIKDQSKKPPDISINKPAPLVSIPKHNDTKAVSLIHTSANRHVVIQTKTKGRSTIMIAENKSATNAEDHTKNNIIPADQNGKKENGSTVPAKVDQNNNVPVATVENKLPAEKNISKEEDKIVADQTYVNGENKKTEKKKALVQKEHGFYAGIVISPDLSNIKFQTIKKPGVSMGIVAGYQLNKKFSIESGASWAIKNYYSKGEYFNTNDIRLPSGAKITSVDGLCNMIEVPLGIKYQVIVKGKNAFTVSAGTSSYFMKKEKYVYDVERNGQQYPYAATYKIRSAHLFAVASVAAGYNYKIENTVILRLEPYVKIPFKGIGTGNLPILSTGVNIGITKQLTW